jgi:hypothetical protein
VDGMDDSTMIAGNMELFYIFFLILSSMEFSVELLLLPFDDPSSRIAPLGSLSLVPW